MSRLRLSYRATGLIKIVLRLIKKRGAERRMFRDKLVSFVADIYQ